MNYSSDLTWLTSFSPCELILSADQNFTDTAAHLTLTHAMLWIRRTILSSSFPKLPGGKAEAECCMHIHSRYAGVSLWSSPEQNTQFWRISLWKRNILISQWAINKSLLSHPNYVNMINHVLKAKLEETSVQILVSFCRRTYVHLNSTSESIWIFATSANAHRGAASYLIKSALGCSSRQCKQKSSGKQTQHYSGKCPSEAPRFEGHAVEAWTVA